MTKNNDIAGYAIRVGGIAAWFQDAELAQDWASEHYFGQWLMHPCAVPFSPDGISAREGGIAGFAVQSTGGMVAWFLELDQAEAWVAENLEGPDLIRPFGLPNKLPFTPEQLEAARIKGELMLAKFQPGRIADPDF